jgi:hypothetical protein
MTGAYCPGFSGQPGEFRFWIEQVHLAWSTVLDQVNNGLRLSGKVRFPSFQVAVNPHVRISWRIIGTNRPPPDKSATASCPNPNRDSPSISRRLNCII